MTVRPAVWLPILAIAFASIVGTAIWYGMVTDVGTELSRPSTEGPAFGRDFAAFQLAGERVVDSHDEALYDVEAEEASGRSPFRNPPFYALLMTPFAFLDFITGYLLWTLLGIVSLAVGLRLLGVQYPLAWFGGTLLAVAGVMNVS